MGRISLVLIERSAELKRDLVDFACSPRLERSLAAAMLEAGLEELEEADAIGTIDRFALQYRMRDGRTVVDRFVASRPDLDAADREMLLGWRDPVEGIFEIRSKDRDAIILLNLIDDLEYRTYSNMGPAFPAAAQGRIRARSPRADPPGARGLAGLRDDDDLPQVRRRIHREGRAGTGDETARAGLPQPGEDRAGLEADAGGPGRVRGVLRRRRAGPSARRGRGTAQRLLPAAAGSRARQEAWPTPAPEPPWRGRARLRVPAGLADADTVGVIFDDVDGLNIYPDYGMLRDLFGDPVLAADKQYADVLRGYLGSETIAPLPLQRLAAAHPDTVDAVFRKILRKRDFTWAEHGEALMRRRKAWYYRREPRPGVSVIGDRLLELAFGGRW